MLINSHYYKYTGGPFNGLLEGLGEARSTMLTLIVEKTSGRGGNFT